MPGDTWWYWNNTTTSNTTATLTTTWTGWNAGYSTSTATTSNYLVTTWGGWNGQFDNLTPEQVAAAQVAHQEAVARAAADAAKRAEEMKAAEAKAEILLLDHLTPAQAKQYKRDSLFHVIAPSGRKYRIRRGWSGNVRLLEERNGREQEVESLCIHPVERVPDQDNMLAQALLLQADEDVFRQIANRRPLQVVA